MCEQTPIEYKKGDIVWVKLGPCWWPGEVQDVAELPQEWMAKFKKPPITAVRFFGEETYEYVRSIDRIYFYNCTKKMEFIRKGLDMHRAKNSFMEKFPDDVATAEKMTNGDPDIINDPAFTPEKKINFGNILFGSPKSKKKSTRNRRNSSNNSFSGNSARIPTTSTSKKQKLNNISSNIRGEQTCSIRILLQPPPKGEKHIKPDPLLNCTHCGFSTTRMNVFIVHSKSHTFSSSKPKKSETVKGKKRLKMPRSEKSTTRQNLELLNKAYTDTDDDAYANDWDDDIKPTKKRKRIKRKSTKEVVQKKQKTKIDIRNNLLAEWEEDSDHEEDKNINISKSLKLNTVDDAKPSCSSTSESDKKVNDKSCFDFKEEEDLIIGTSVGRKIPRVIPPPDRRKSIETVESPNENRSNSNDICNVVKDMLNKDTTHNKVIVKEALYNDKHKGVSMEDAVDKNGTCNKVIVESALHKNDILNQIVMMDTLHKDNVCNEVTVENALLKDDTDNETIVENAFHKTHNEVAVDNALHKDEISNEVTVDDILDKGDIQDEIMNDVLHKDDLHNEVTVEDTVNKDNIHNKIIIDDLFHHEDIHNKITVEDTLNEDDTHNEFIVDFAFRHDNKPNEVSVDDAFCRDNSYNDITVKDILDNETHKEVTEDDDFCPNDTHDEFTVANVMHKNEIHNEVTVDDAFHQDDIHNEITGKAILDIDNKHNEDIMDDVFHCDDKVDEVNMKDTLYKDDNVDTEIIMDDALHGDAYNEISVKDALNEDNIHNEVIVDDPLHKDDIYNEVTMDDMLHKDDSHSTITVEDMLYKENKCNEVIVKDALHTDNTYNEVFEDDSLDIENTHNIGALEDTLHKDGTFNEDAVDDSLHRNDTNNEIITEATLHKEEFNIIKINDALNDDDTNNKAVLCKKDVPNENFMEDTLHQSDTHKEVILENVLPKNKASNETYVENTFYKFDMHKMIVEDLLHKDNLPNEESRLNDDTDNTIMEETVNKTDQAFNEGILPSAESSLSHDFMESEFQRPSVSNEDKKIIENLEEFNNLLEETVVPDIPQIPETLKFTHNFYNSKLPDNSEATVQDEPQPKSEANERISSMEIINPKKRLVKSFVDSEQRLHKKPRLPKEPEKIVEIGKLKTQLMSKLENIDRMFSAEVSLPVLSQEEVEKDPWLIKQSEVEVLSSKTPDSEIEDIPKDFDEPRIKSPELSITNPIVASPQLSLKIPEMKETIPFEMEEISDLNLELMEPAVVYVKPVQVLEEKKQVEVLQVNPIIETRTELQFNNNIPHLTDNLNADINININVQGEIKEIASHDASSEEKSERSFESDNNTSFSCTNSDSMESEDLSAEFAGLSYSTEEETNTTITIPDKGNLTYLNEDDLADSQIEIADVSYESNPKPLNLSSFSVDFTDSSQGILLDSKNTTTAVSPLLKKRKYSQEIEETDSVEKSLGKVFEEERKPECLVLSDADVEDDIISATSCTSGKNKLRKLSKQGHLNMAEFTTGSSKLMEILTDKSNFSKNDIPNYTKIDSLPKSAGASDLLQFRKISASPKLFANDMPKFPITNTNTEMMPKLITDDGLSKTPNVLDMSRKIEAKLQIGALSKENKSKFTKNKSKPVILSERIIKPSTDCSETVSVQKISSRGIKTDIEDIDAFIIQKPANKFTKVDEDATESTISVLPKKLYATRGKAKILQQTIIKPATDVSPTVDDNMFDINSMPIVMGDQIISAETIENMPVIISESSNTKIPVPQNESMTVKTYPSQKSSKNPKVFQTSSTPRIMKTHPSIISRSSKADKFIIVPQTTSTASTSKYTVGKKPQITKRPVILPSSTSTAKLQTTSSFEPTGNKIMIVTNQQGQQSRVLLTPAHQKLLTCQMPTSKLVKNTLKGNILQKSVTTKLTTTASLVVTNTSNHNAISDGQAMIPIKSEHMRKKFEIQPRKILLKEGLKCPKTIVIKNQQGQIVKKILGSDEAILEQQVAEQVQAIKASESFNAMKRQEAGTSKLKQATKRSYTKKAFANDSTKITKVGCSTSKLQNSESAIPPLMPISPKPPSAKTEEAKQENILKKQYSQLVIQDSLGNQTPVKEGQLLAFPSGESADGQNQSYMLVSMDDSGNLVPLSSQALLSLDPNLSLDGDISNMMLQVEDGSVSRQVSSTPVNLKQIASSLGEAKAEQSTEHKSTSKDQVQTITCNMGNNSNQQFIITGDPASTEKFIQSLAEGTTDISKLLASTEGNILIQTDEQQILINANTENPVLLPENQNNQDANMLFSTQPKNQDILAAALANTDVFQPEQSPNSPIPSKLVQSQLSPNSGLYPTGVSNVLETTLSLSSPIMTPLEVPSSNTKKIPDDVTDILTTEVPKNVDLPITITDPNISQTVSQQHVASLIASELTNNLELPLTITDQGIPLTSAEMNNPSFVYSLPSLDEPEDLHQKPFSGPISMPLLTEDPQELEKTKIEQNKDNESSDKRLQLSSIEDCVKASKKLASISSFLGTTVDPDEGLCTLGGAMCSSLSEPPPDMFDLGIVNSSYVTNVEDMKKHIPDSSYLLKVNDQFSEDFDDKFENQNNDTSKSNLNLSSSSNSPIVNIDDNSCEIPVQPQIVTDLSSPFETTNDTDFHSNKRKTDSRIESEKKKIRFD